MSYLRDDLELLGNLLIRVEWNFSVFVAEEVAFHIENYVSTAARLADVCCLFSKGNKLHKLARVSLVTSSSGENRARIDAFVVVKTTNTLTRHFLDRFRRSLKRINYFLSSCSLLIAM